MRDPTRCFLHVRAERDGTLPPSGTSTKTCPIERTHDCESVHGRLNSVNASGNAKLTQALRKNLLLEVERLPSRGFDRVRYRLGREFSQLDRRPKKHERQRTVDSCPQSLPTGPRSLQPAESMAWTSLSADKRVAASRTACSGYSQTAVSPSLPQATGDGARHLAWAT